MKKSLPIFLLLISIAFLSCGPTRHLTKTNAEAHTFQPPLNDYSTALYKAHIKVGNMAFSGLFYFKKDTDGLQRIIFLSELGLTFLEMVYEENSFKVNKCQDFIDSKTILSNFMNDLQLLIDQPVSPTKLAKYENENGNLAVVKFRSRKKKHFYFYEENGELGKIVQKKGLRHVEIDLQNGEKNVPQKIEVKHKRIKLYIKLKLLRTNAG